MSEQEKVYKDKHWIQMIMSHEEPEQVPYCFDFTPPARRNVEKHYGFPIEETLSFPVRMTGCTTIKPLYADPSDFGETGRRLYSSPSRIRQIKFCSLLWGQGSGKEQIHICQARSKSEFDNTYVIWYGMQWR